MYVNNLSISHFNRERVVADETDSFSDLYFTLRL